MVARRLYVPDAQPSRDDNGRALPAKLYFYEPTGTFDTPKTVYANSALTTPLAFPVVSDASGRFPAMWADDAQKFDVLWSDQVFDQVRGRWTNVSPLTDAVLASADLAADAQAGAEAAEAGAQAAQAGAETAKAGAEAAVAELGDLTGAIGQAQGAADDAAASAQAAADSAAAAATWDPANYVQKTRAVTGGGVATGGGDFSTDRVITVTAATPAENRAGTSSTKVMVPSESWATLDEVSLGYSGANVVTTGDSAPDMSKFTNATISLTQNSTLPNPTNPRVNQSGRIRVVNGGSWTLAYGGNWKPANATTPTVQTGAGAISIIDYDVISPTYIRFALMKM